MNKRFLTLFLCLWLVGLSACASFLNEAKTDATILGMTGWGISIGINSIPTPTGTPIPIPSIMIWRGTMFRVGVTESAEIKTGESIKGDIGSTGQPSPGVQTEGTGSLSITTHDTSKALEKMKDLYSRGSK